MDTYEIAKEEANHFVRDVGRAGISIYKERREYGMHLTSIDIFKKFILIEIKDLIFQYSWIDLFAGEGNLILPMLDIIPKEKRIEFFKQHIFLFDIQKKMVERAIANAKQRGIPHKLAITNIMTKDTLKDYPTFIKKLPHPPFHITNPPYLYIGYVAKHSPRNLLYFSGKNEGYQDLYQIALINDLRHNLERMIYIIPTNFLFGFSVSNKIRKDFLQFYSIKRVVIFEKKIFEFTGTNVCICFFQRKSKVSFQPIVFEALKVNDNNHQKKIYRLYHQNYYRAGSEFDEFVLSFKSFAPLKVDFYLTLEEIEKNKGGIPVKLLDTNSFSNGYYKIVNYNITQELYQKIKDNPLFIRTLDTGSWEGRAGIYNVKETFNVDGIIVTKAKYRTHPIQIFLEPCVSYSDTDLLKAYFNTMLEYFRAITDSEFLTTFKYSNSEYIRKYLGLSQTVKLIQTLPIHLMTEAQKKVLQILIEQKNVVGIKDMLSHLKERKGTQLKLL